MRRRTFLTAAAVAAAVGYRTWSRRLPELPDDVLSVASWNLRNFPSATHDPGRIARTLAALQADVIALQEIRLPSALPLPHHQVHVSRRGGPHGQRLGVAIDPARVTLVAAHEDSRIDLDGRVRPAFVATLDTVLGPLTVVVVHLKARPTGADAREIQWAGIVKLVRELAGPVVAVGDWNTTGGAAERDALTTALGPADLGLVQNNRGCSAYWEGVRHDGWQEPSLLDLAFVRTGEGITALDPATPHGHCAQHACEPFRSTAAHPDLDLTRASDHCPLRFALAKRGAPGAN
jgi:endonuclease/exonuclease/phosphatase family metal-dependent hydrolase